MRLLSAVVVFCLLAVLASHVVQGSDASAGSNAGRQADLAGIEKFHQRDAQEADRRHLERLPRGGVLRVSELQDGGVE